MPNHITNELTAIETRDTTFGGPGINEILDLLAGDEGALDFNRVIPMPDVVKGERAGYIDDWALLAMGRYPLSYFNQPPADAASHC